MEAFISLLYEVVIFLDRQHRPIFVWSYMGTILQNSKLMNNNYFIFCVCIRFHENSIILFNSGDLQSFLLLPFYDHQSPMKNEKKCSQIQGLIHLLEIFRGAVLLVS